MKGERLSAHIAYVWRFRLSREVSAAQAPPLPLKGTERGLLPSAHCALPGPMDV